MQISGRIVLLLAFGLVATSLSVAGQRPGKASPCSGLSDCAYPLLNARVTANQQAFFVYQDADSGFNHGTVQLFASPGMLMNEVVITAACIDDQNSPSGCSSNPESLDRTRGTVFAVAFPALMPNQDVGLYFYDSVGYNLSPANQVQFDVRSPTGGTVQFYVNNCVVAIANLPRSWEHLSVSIPSSCQPSPVQSLFTVSVSTTTQSQPAVTVLLDNIQFTPVPTRQLTEPSSPLSTQTFGVLPAQYSSCPEIPHVFHPTKSIEM